MTTSVRGVEGALPRSVPAPASASRPGSDFADVLRSAGIALSHHAQGRVARSGLAEAEGARLRDAIDRAKAKHIDTAAILLDEMTFIVSVRDRTLITAVGSDRARDEVFTDIDGLVKA